MRKKILNLVISVFLFNLMIAPVFADVNNIVSPIPADLFTLVGNLTNLLQPAVLITFVGVTFFGGYLRMTAAGDADQEARSMKVLTGGIIGFIIVVLAPVVVNFIAQLLNIRI